MTYFDRWLEEPYDYESDFGPEMKELDQVIDAMLCDAAYLVGIVAPEDENEFAEWAATPNDDGITPADSYAESHGWEINTGIAT